MKRIAIVFTMVAGVFFSSCDTLNQTAQILGQNLGNPTSAEIALGLKQALEFGTNYSSERLSSENGYFGNAAIKILFPPEALKAERTLRSLGLNKLADNVILSVNRAAEDAAREAKPIFINAIKQMTIADASNILLGRQTDAATQYFKRVTTTELMQKFRPVIQTSLGRVGATKYWSDAITAYNQIPLTADINPDLSSYVAQKAIEGLFLEIAQEELKIRQNISSRNTSLLQKVFGYADRNRQ
ncbi:MAG: DUF4197 domain-containing protein [Sphingobacteriaceae bacterium]|nr:DUF4197 domain-containing protein [Sphingobacteriaceae bacterium]